MGGGEAVSGPGTLWGVGVGPGDPDLMTLRAHRLIAGAAVVAYPAPLGGASFARSIAAGAIRADAVEIPIEIPMETARFPAQAVYDRAAAAIGDHLGAGRDVVVLCEGDPFFYGSYMYLHARLSGRYPARVVPGVTSLTACAAAWGRPLSSRNGILTILPAPLEAAALSAGIAAAEAVAILKVGRHLPKVRAVLDALGLIDRAGYVERASLPVERVLPLADAPAEAPYFSMILVTKDADPWLT